MDKNNKVGLMTKEEAQFFGKLIAGEVPVTGIYKMVVGFALPALINGLDDKYGEKLPEPWQTYVEDLVTALYNALQDKVLTDQEIADITDKVAKVLATEIHIPIVDEDTELEAFQYLLKYLAAMVKSIVAKK